MEHKIEPNEIVSLLAEYCRGDSEETDDVYMINVRRRESAIGLSVAKELLHELSERLGDMRVNDETALYTDNSYEVIVREESATPMRRIREDKIEISNEESGIRYELSAASDEYLVWLLHAMREKVSPRDLRFSIFYTPRIDKILEEKKEVSAFDFIRLTSLRLLTLKITSEKKQSPQQFNKLTHSFLFHIGYNLDVALVPQRLIEEMARRGRITRMRRSRTEELDPPRRSYTEDLVQHYLLAVSTDNPVIEFLSYYHVLEHFFESVFNEDLIEAIRSKLTDPGFSYKRKRDITVLVNSIKRALQIRSETITFSESEALRLCLAKFVNLAELSKKLAEYDESLLGYYKQTRVEFSGGVEVDLYEADQEKIFKDLTKRIYVTRNSLVHSKDGDKGKYTPFRDDRVLVKEVPLMRFIAEMVILSESSVQ